ncbi:AfsR/SARP family transcriptional regulator [Streptomyces violascens]|uniref:AfsR/SARP family transcriptional regulator n=1 Tax=Streptomyces violascens TaxID=67381 RepID=UPI00365717B3
MMDGARELHFSVLGPVRAWRGGEALPSGSPQQRALLAALLLRDGRAATAAELIEAIWGDEPPSQALPGVRTYASRLRKVLDPGVLVSESGGYAIRAGAAGLDITEARELATAAEEARARGDQRQARDLLNQSLGLWDGEPLAGVPGPYAEAQRTRLAEWRLQLTEARLDMDLEAGCHAEAVSELTALTAAHPLRERLRELLMLALYRSGRQAEALAVYADTRRLLADELGVDPRPELARLQQRILQADEDLARPAQAATSVPSVGRPIQLPASVADFTGRAAIVRELSAHLASVESPVMAVSALAGIGGVGKTTLAVHVAHAARPNFPDGQLYVDLQGAGGRPADPEAVLGAFLRALGTPDQSIPDSLDERAAMFRSALGGRRVFVLLDNARDAAQIRPLLPGTEGCATLITSRIRMLDLPGAHLVDLDVMSPDEALRLFTRIVGVERVSAEREAALDVVAACGFLPLAIRIAASRLASRRTWTVSVLAAKLADERRRLDELQAGDLAVKATFELGYGQLEPAQAHAFRLLALPDGPDISLAAAAAVLDLPEQDTEDLLESLVDTSLVESAAPGRYRYNDLVRLYARSCAERDEQLPGEGRLALSRLLDFYLATAARAYAIELFGGQPGEHLAPTAHPGLSFDGRELVVKWLNTEARCLLACARQSAASGELRRAADLVWVIRDLAGSGANAKLYETTTTEIRDMANSACDVSAEGRSRVALARSLLINGRFEEAEEQARTAALLAHTADDPAVVGWALNHRGVASFYQDRLADGEDFLRASIADFRANRNQAGTANALSNLSHLQIGVGRTTMAVEMAQEAVAIQEALQLPGRAYSRLALGTALLASSRYPEALAQLGSARQEFHADRQPLWEGTSNFRIAQAHLVLGQVDKTVLHAEQALALGCTGGDGIRREVLTLLGRAFKQLDQLDRARACFREARETDDQSAIEPTSNRPALAV